MLVLLAALASAVAYLFTRNYYADVQSPARYWPVTLLIIGLGELYTAYMTAARLAGKTSRPIHPIAVARLAALAKASSPVGALMAGGYAGFLLHVARLAGPQAGTDTVTAALGAAFGLVLAICALVLERVCRVKTPPDSGNLDGSLDG
ncbi:MAG: hypothetical protein QOG34_736 [Frankiaceae bacterium]|nr:hypothetical protein [Frankiaceae bacterium]